MHAMFFGIKRVHLRVLAITRPLLVEAGLTPARFDMLRLISKHPDGILQRNIQYVLGVSAATVSRMLRSLELLGNVVRRVWDHDRRCTLVRITHVGAYALYLAHRETTEPCVDLRMAAHALTGDPRASIESSSVLRSIRGFEDRLLTARRAYQDPSPVRNPWAPVQIPFMERADIVDGTWDYPTALRPLRFIRDELPTIVEPMTFDWARRRKTPPRRRRPRAPHAAQSTQHATH